MPWPFINITLENWIWITFSKFEKLFGLWGMKIPCYYWTVFTKVFYYV